MNHVGIIETLQNSPKSNCHPPLSAEGKEKEPRVPVRWDSACITDSITNNVAAIKLQYLHVRKLQQFSTILCYHFVELGIFKYSFGLVWAFGVGGSSKSHNRSNPAVTTMPVRAARGKPISPPEKTILIFGVQRSTEFDPVSTAFC